MDEGAKGKAKRIALIYNVPHTSGGMHNLAIDTMVWGMVLNPDASANEEEVTCPNVAEVACEVYSSNLETVGDVTPQTVRIWADRFIQSLFRCAEQLKDLQEAVRKGIEWDTTEPASKVPEIAAFCRSIAEACEMGNLVLGVAFRTRTDAKSLEEFLRVPLRFGPIFNPVVSTVQRIAVRYAAHYAAQSPSDRAQIGQLVQNIYAPDSGNIAMNKISINGSNISGSNVGGVESKIEARDITTYNHVVDNSQHIDADLKAKLKQARQEIEHLNLSAGDKSDVLDDLRKFTDEIGTEKPEPSRITKLWGRIKDNAPTVAKILASAVAVGKLIAMAHGSPPTP